LGGARLYKMRAIDFLNGLCLGEVAFLVYSLFSSPVQPTSEQIRTSPAIVREYNQEQRNVLNAGLYVGLAGFFAGGLASRVLNKK